ncbi:GNAT family N-acetyltransferase [Halomonas sp. BLK-85]
MMGIRLLSGDHLAALLDLEATAGSGMQPAALASALTAPDIKVLSAWQAADKQRTSQPIGYAIVAIGPFDAEIEAMGVRPDWRRQGVARWLMQAVIEEVTQADSERLLLDVRETNDPAIRLYQTFGFTFDGRRKGYYPAVGDTAGRRRVDALLMSRAMKD